MGKRSNIIFCDENNMILGAVKHISANMSSLREVLPGREYFYPKTADKKDPLNTSEEEFCGLISSKDADIQKAIYQSYNGISPQIASEICFRSSIDPETMTSSLSKDTKKHIYNHFSWLMDDIKNGRFFPCIIYSGREPVDFSCIKPSMYEGYEIKEFSSVSEVIHTYYKDKEVYSRIRQKSSDLRKVVSNAIDRTRRKYDLQLRQMKDTEKKDKYKLYGELLNAYGYSVKAGEKKCELLNYYTNENIIVPLDSTISAQENSQKYFARYNKLKRTAEALSSQLESSKSELDHLMTIDTSLGIAVSEADLMQIKDELINCGYIKRHTLSKKVSKPGKSTPFHYISSDGFDMYVGKNNLQNDELTFKVANGGDWWFHAKKTPGSHVIVKTGGKEARLPPIIQAAEMQVRSRLTTCSVKMSKNQTEQNRDL